PLAPSFALFWAGILVAISFIEAPLKFRAFGISLKRGLGIGKLVFSTLNKTEWVLLLGILLSFLPFYRRHILGYLIFILPVACLMVQSFYLLPRLNHRTDLIFQGINPGISSDHPFYIMIGGTKVLSLIFFSILQYKHLKNL